MEGSTATETTGMTAAVMTGGMIDAAATTAATTDTAATMTDVTTEVGETTETAGGADGTRTGRADVSLERMTVS